MTAYPKRLVYSIWIPGACLKVFKAMLVENSVDYIECSTVDNSGRILFQLWLPFDPSLLMDMQMFPKD